MSAPELAVDEIGEAAEAKADRGDDGHAVGKAEQRYRAAAAEQDQGCHHAQHAAMKTHPARPYGGDLQRMGEVKPWLIKKHIAKPAAEHHAKRRPGEEIVSLHLCGNRGRLEHQAAHHLPAGDEADDVGERVPTDGEGTQMQQDWVEAGELQGGTHRKEAVLF